MQLQCIINEQTSLLVVIDVNFINDNINVINDNINVNAINGHHWWTPLMDAINGHQ
jgi:hypothetical protein